MLTYRSMTKLFSSPLVVVRVEGREFRLPKELLCYNSLFFDRAFNGPWSRKDGEDGEREIEFSFATRDTFELVIQWMYLSDIVLPHPHEPAKDRAAAGTVTDPVYLGGEHAAENSSIPPSAPAASHTITTYLAFFKLADALGLLGPFDAILDRITAALQSSEEALQAAHIHEASELPRGHAVRRMFARACLRSYVQETMVALRGEYRFAREVREIEGFAADLFYEFGEAVRSGEARQYGF
jgi:hypothetical protein